MRIRIDQHLQRRDHCIDMVRSVDWPRVVPVSSTMREHEALTARALTVHAALLEKQTGVAIRIRKSRWRNRVVYWTRRKGSWSFDCRRVGDKLTLIGFLDVPTPGFPVDTGGNI